MTDMPSVKASITEKVSIGECVCLYVVYAQKSCRKVVCGMYVCMSTSFSILRNINRHTALTSHVMLNIDKKPTTHHTLH